MTNVLVKDYGLYVAGKSVDAASSATIDVVDPGNDQHLAKVADAGVEDGLLAVRAAADAAAGWAATPARTRAEILRRAFDLMTERTDDIGELITLENGKALSEARGEVAYAAEFLRWFSEEACRGLGTFGSSPDGSRRVLTDLRPVGVCVFVTPWNFPAAMATRKIGPALAAGCTVVLKPAEETPLTAYAMAEIFAEAGVPAGVVNVVTTSRAPEVVAAMMADQHVRKISFTGSTEVGRILLRQAADRVLRCSMELGGNAPFLVLEDADMDVAVDSAMVAKLRNGGQSCTAANRFYVHRSRAEEFAQRLAAVMRDVKVGYGLDEASELGAMVSHEAAAKVHRIGVESVAAGARLVTGGEVLEGPGAFYAPTVLTDVPADAACLQEEIFGPVAPIVAFDSDDEVVALANDTEFGLVAFIQSADMSRALAMADRLEAGMVGINRGVVSDPAAPFGGWKQSGLGREGAHDGLLEFLETKYIAAAW